MKKEIGNALALYPTPLAVVGAMVDGKPNYVLVGHLGIIGPDRIMVSLAKPHYTNKGIKQTHHLTVNMVSVDMLPKADNVGCVSGNTESKENVFVYHTAKTGAPIIDEYEKSRKQKEVDHRPRSGGSGKGYFQNDLGGKGCRNDRPHLAGEKGACIDGILAKQRAAERR